MSKGIKHLFVQNLVQYFAEDGTLDEPVVVSVPGTATFEETAATAVEGLMPIKAKAYHDSANANGSAIDSVVFTEKTKSCEFKPLLGHIVTNDKGEMDFGSHDYEFVLNEDGEEYVRYLEQPIGVLTGEFSFEYDAEQQVNRAILDGYLYEEYCNDAVEILENRGGKAQCSIELFVNRQHFDRKQKLLYLDDYYIMGLTLLGADRLPGMVGSEVKLADFDQQKTDSTEGLDAGSDSFSLEDGTEKGGKGVKTITFKIGDQEYEKTLEEKVWEVYSALYAQFRDYGLDYDIVSLYEDYAIVGPWGSDKTYRVDYHREDDGSIVIGENFTEVESVWKEIGSEESVDFEEQKKKKEDPDNDSPAPEEEDEDKTPAENPGNTPGENPGENPGGEGGEDEGSDDEGNDDEGGVVAESLKEYEALKAELEEVKAELAKYQIAEERAEKLSVLEAASYKQYENEEPFKALVKDIDKYTLDEFKTQAKLAFADCSMSGAPAQAVEPNEITPSVSVGVRKAKNQKRRYGNLFAKK